eukprot:CAMPEP_0171971710 /NCGR_PEP_ID=MMETSP0993-20121228/219106_1 /TAXON_ID=483369 /ORGANISM="non described non described, Strain CCMP2098" /LENGTH=63 /DNA_ID=CAMNT_0012622101 /DNA_START=78 /DNA_END=266 /DNA_ORIENTATION=-
MSATSSAQVPPPYARSTCRANALAPSMFSTMFISSACGSAPASSFADGDTADGEDDDDDDDDD